MKRTQLLASAARTLAIGAAVLIAGAAVSSRAHAGENGSSVYLLGSGGPGAAVMPPLQGVFLANEIYVYSGKLGADVPLPLGGSVVAGVDATVIADFPTLLWVPTTDWGGGTLALGVSLPFGEPSVDVSAVITGPRGRMLSAGLSDSAFVIGDPIVTAMWGFKNRNLHVQLGAMINVPIGDYREDELANLAFHRWAGDVSLAGTWLSEETGWDVSGKAGVTFNGRNDYTEYDTGTELHFEAAVQKKVSKSWALGVQAYHLQQISDDTGAGATLGPYKGRVSGVGATAAYDFILAKKPANLRFSASTEFDVENRPEGGAFWVSLSLPLFMKLPPGAKP